jgi:hypothetical protein
MHITTTKIIDVIIHFHASFFVPPIGVSLWHLYRKENLNTNKPAKGH